MGHQTVKGSCRRYRHQAGQDKLDYDRISSSTDEQHPPEEQFEGPSDRRLAKASVGGVQQEHTQLLLEVHIPHKKAFGAATQTAVLDP